MLTSRIEGLTDTQKLEDQILETLLNEKEFDETNLLLSIKNRLPIANKKKVSTYAACVDAISAGNPILLLDGSEEALSLGLVKFEKRSIEEPQAKTAIRGPREGFTESLELHLLWSLVIRLVCL